jgi:hypothetical protein
LDKGIVGHGSSGLNGVEKVLLGDQLTRPCRRVAQDIEIPRTEGNKTGAAQQYALIEIDAVADEMTRLQAARPSFRNSGRL